MTEINNLPAALRENALFCCWRYEERDGRRTKVPYNPRTGGRAQSTNPDTFAPLRVAAQVQGHYDGLGVGIFGRLGAIDIDHCVSEEGDLSDLAAGIMSAMNAYTEYSPSGKGFRILFTVPEGFQYDKARYYINNQKAGLEVYIAGSTNKFVTVTGNTLTPGKDLEERGEALGQVLERYMVRPQAERPTPSPAPSAADNPAPVDALDDLALIEQAKQSRKGADFARLWAGDISGYQSHSEADIALCNALAWWTNGDAGRVDRLFRQSGLMRQKWDRPQSGSTYGAITVQNAVAGLRGGYDPQSRGQAIEFDFGPEPSASTETTAVPTLIRAADVPYEPPRWLLAPYFQLGKGTMIQGDNGTGKTAFMCAIAAHVSTGRPLLGLEVEAPGDVIMLSTEDDLPVLRGRIEADGGDLTRCHFMTNAAGLTFNSPEVEAAIQQVKAKLVVFDPIQAFMGAGVDMFRPNETRPLLAKLFETCDRHDCACAIIAHTGKAAGDKSPVNRALGSVDIPASMRSILQLIRNPDNEEECVMVHVKCSNAPKGRSIAYQIGDRGGVQWMGFSDLSVDDLSTIQKRKEKGIPYEKEPLVQVFNQLITDKPGGGFWSYEDVKRIGAQLLGFPPFYSTNDLKTKLNSAFCRELQEKDGLIVTCGHRSHGERGIRIEQYRVPQGYQTEIDG